MKLYEGDRITSIDGGSGILVAAVEDGNNILLTYYCNDSASCHTIKPNRILSVDVSTDLRHRIVGNLKQLVESGEIRSTANFTDFSDVSEDIDLTSVPECDLLLNLVLNRIPGNANLLADVATCIDHAWTVQEMADAVIDCMESDKDASLAYIKGMAESDLISLHHSLGRWIRNTFLLWSNTNLEYLDSIEHHPDSFSMEVIRCMHTKLTKSQA